jgi:hypothetical protein
VRNSYRVTGGASDLVPAIPPRGGPGWPRPAGDDAPPASVECVDFDPSSTWPTFAAANGGSATAIISRLRMQLNESVGIKQIRAVECLANVARDLAARARQGRQTVNAIARQVLDSRRKLGQSLIEMQERGELASPGENLLYQRGTCSLAGLGLTRNQSSRYQLEARVPPDVYEAWVADVLRSDDRMLTAAGLRRLAGQNSGRPLSLAKAAGRFWRLTARVREEMSPDAFARLPKLVRILAREIERECRHG